MTSPSNAPSRNLRKLGHVKPPVDAAQALLAALRAELSWRKQRYGAGGVFSDRLIVQGFASVPCENDHIRKIAQAMSPFVNTDVLEDVDAMAFKHVDWHNDYWPRVGGRAPYFFHLFLSGGGKLFVGKQSLTVRRGDVIMHSPNVQHKFVPNTPQTVTMCVTGAANATALKGCK